MFSIRFQTMLIIMTTAVLTIFLYEMLREETLDFVSIQEVTSKTIAAQSDGATIKLPRLAVTSKSKVVSVPDGGALLFGGGIMRRPEMLNLPPSGE